VPSVSEEGRMGSDYLIDVRILFEMMEKFWN
jgi:hypothetical protein